MIHADDVFGAAAADVHHQPLFAVIRQAAGDALINKAGFFDAGDDFNGMPECLFGLDEKLPRIAGDAQGVGANGTHTARWHVPQTLAEALEAIQSFALGLFRQEAVWGQPGGKADHFPQAVNHDQFPLAEAGDNHMETIGAKVNGGDEFRRGGFRHDPILK